MKTALLLLVAVPLLAAPEKRPVRNFELPDEKLRELRKISSQEIEIPSIEQMWVNGKKVWQKKSTSVPRLKPKDLVVLKGTGFGLGPDIDYAKILIGNIRVLERDLNMYEGKINLLKRLFYESNKTFDEWPQEILSWSRSEIKFQVPETASHGPLVISVQKRIGELASLKNPSKFHIVKDPLTERIEKNFTHKTDVVSVLGEPMLSDPLEISVNNKEWQERWSRGEAIFWGYDFNIGLVHEIKNAEWDKILAGKALDPITGEPADPETLIGAHRAEEGEVPSIVFDELYFDPFPMPMPVRSVLRPPLLKGSTFPTGYVGRVRAEAIHPITMRKGQWAGENCASCHTKKITYEIEPGVFQTKFFPGLPNTDWSIKWATLGNMAGVKGTEVGPDGKKAFVDKTMLLYHLPNGATENALVRGSDEGSRYDNDHLYAPVVIPSLSTHTPLRRALARTEMIVGFEGSYIHAEEPDGAVGALDASSLKDLTVYMSTLDRDRELLRRLGLYRWLKQNGLLSQVDNVAEWQFLKTGLQGHDALNEQIEAGKETFEQNCLNCHRQNFNTWTDENMISLTEVGTFFSPSIFHRETQSIRTSYLEDLFWMQDRGLLHDGHVKTLEDLVHPDRCKEGTELYKQYYSLNENSFKIPMGTEAQKLATLRHAYFVEMPWDKKNLYWDYQGMRREFGKREFGLKTSLPLPPSPHPWCLEDALEITPLVLYLLTL